MKKKVFIILSIVLLSIISLIIILFFIIKSNSSYQVPDGYIAEFHGGYGEVTYTTYIYKIDNSKDNYGFKYISVEYTTISYGNPQSKGKLIEKGEVGFTDEVFTVAKKNNSYSYVKLPNDNSKIYSIEEYQNMFLMD